MVFLPKLIYFSTLAASLGYFAIAIFLLIKNRFNKINLIFCAWLIIWSVWNMGLFLTYSSSNVALALKYTYFIDIPLVFMPTTLFHFSVLFTDSLNAATRRLIKIAYGTSLFFIPVILMNPVIFNQNHLWINGVKYFEWGYTPQIGLGSLVFTIVWLFFLVASLKLQYRQLKKSHGRYHQQLKFIFWGFIILYIVSGTNFLPVMGIHVPPLGNIMSLPFALAIIYSIIKYETFDVHIFFRKSIFLSVFILVIFFSYSIFISLFKIILNPIFNNHEMISNMIYSVLLAATIVPLQNLIDQFLFKFYGKKNATTQEMMNDFYLKLKQSYIKPDILLDLTVLELGKIFQLQRAYITYESVKGQLKHHHLYDINKDSINFSEECQNLMDKNPDFKIILKNHKGSLDYGSLIYEILTEPDLQKKEVLRNLRDEMEKSKLSGVFALDDQKYVRNGFLFVGTKLAEVELDANEFSIMKNFILPLQIGISNTELNAEAFRKQREVDQLEKMATLGKMGRGLAHEIKNPLMSIKTFFELGPDLNQNDRESFSNLAKTQLKRIDGLIEKLKGYTQPEKIIKEKIEFKKMVEKMENFLKPELVKNKIIFENKVDSRFNIYVDQNRFEQVLINLIQNAVQAKDDAKATSFIEVSADTEKSVIFIRDNGKGMNAEQIQNIFTPFYTTKKDGNGLGLSIVQNIIESHGGIINVESALDRGTLFQIKL